MAERREKGAKRPDPVRCIAILEDGRCHNTSREAHYCPHCGGALCGIHFDAHLAEEEKRIAWRNACAGRAAAELQVIP